MHTKELARNMRNDPTRAEFILWQKLRCRRLGVKFRRQKPLDGYILDFYCHPLKLGIEVDGNGHDPLRDQWRDSILALRGVFVIRFTNEEVLRRGLEVIEKITTVIAARRGEAFKRGQQ